MSAREYRKRPVTVSAWLFTGEPDADLERWLGDSFESWLPGQRQLVIRTLEGEIVASAGDYIIRGVQGEHYPCKPDIFAATYEEAGEQRVAPLAGQILAVVPGIDSGDYRNGFFSMFPNITKAEEVAQ